MPGTSEPSRSVRQLGSRPAHLSVAFPDQDGNRGNLTRLTQRHLYSLERISVRLRARDAQRRAEHPNPHEIPKIPIFASVETAITLQSIAMPIPQADAPYATDAALKILSTPPSLLVAEGDLAHVRPAIDDLAPAWLDDGWERRVLCAAANGDDSTLARQLQRAGVPPDEQSAVTTIVQASRHLAHEAMGMYSWIRIALEVRPNELPVYVQLPVLTKPGIELAAWARFGQDASRSRIASEALAPNATQQLAAILLQTRDIAPNAAPDKHQRHASNPYPQDRVVGRNGVVPVQRLVQSFFAMAERYPDAISTVAAAVEMNADDAHAALVDLKISMLGRQLRVVRGLE